MNRVHDSIFTIIKEWAQESESKQFLLSNSKGGKLDVKNFRTRNFYPFLKDIGILEKDEKRPRLTPHSTRHTFISEMVKNNSKPEYLQRIVGHEKYETTVDFYTHVREDDFEIMVQQVNAGIKFEKDN